MSEFKVAEGVQTKETGGSDGNLAESIKQTDELIKAREKAKTDAQKNDTQQNQNLSTDIVENQPEPPRTESVSEIQSGQKPIVSTGVTGANGATVSGAPVVDPSSPDSSLNLKVADGNTGATDSKQINKPINPLETKDNQSEVQPVLDSQPGKQREIVTNNPTGEKIVIKEDAVGNRNVKVVENPEVPVDIPKDRTEKSNLTPDKSPKDENVFTAKNLEPEPVRPENKTSSENPSKQGNQSEKSDLKPYSTESSGSKQSTPESNRQEQSRTEPVKPTESVIPRNSEPQYKEPPQPSAKPITQSEDRQPVQLKSNQPDPRPVVPEHSQRQTPVASEAPSSKPATTPEVVPQRTSDQKQEPIIRVAPESKPIVENNKSIEPNLSAKSSQASEAPKAVVPQPKIIEKQEVSKAVDSAKSDNVILATKIKDLVQQVVSANTKDIVRVQAKEELVKIVESAVKKATFEGKNADLIQVIKQIIAEPVIKDSIRVVTGSSGDNHSIKELKALLDQVVAIRNKNQSEQKLELNTANVKRIEDIQGPVITKEAALAALVGILVDADKITSRLVKEVQLETTSKLSQIQSTVDELIKLRVEQFISLSVKGYGVDGATFKALCQETIAELANRYGLNDQQRALLNQILIQISESDFSGGQPSTSTDKDKAKDPQQKDVVDPNKRELTPKEIEALFLKEVETLEAFLKEREEIKRAKAEAELVNLLAEVIDETMSYKIDEDLEVIKVFTIKGIVIHQKTRVPIPNVKIFAGILGMYETDQDGQFIIRNVPQLTRYIIGADHSEYVFTPPYHSGTLDTSVEITFEATSSRL
jgi:hypothetical protein